MKRSHVFALIFASSIFNGIQAVEQAIANPVPLPSVWLITPSYSNTMEDSAQAILL